MTTTTTTTTTTTLASDTTEIQELDRKSVLADYRNIRAVGKSLVEHILNQLVPGDFVKVAKLLGRLEGEKTVVLDSEEESAILMDYAIHDMFDSGKNAIDRLLQNSPPPEGSVEMRVLRSLQQAHYSTLQILETEPGFGVVALDNFRKKKITMVDIGFSQTVTPGVVMAARIYSPGDGWWMSTGAALPITEPARYRIDEAVKAYITRRGKAPTEADMTLLIIRACLKAGASQHVAYADAGAPLPNRRRPEEGEVVGPIHVGAEVGRNDACPCGSGKKYKKCCGK